MSPSRISTPPKTSLRNSQRIALNRSKLSQYRIRALLIDMIRIAMPNTLSQTELNLIEMQLALEKPTKEIAVMIPCNIRTVQRIAENLHLFGVTRLPRIARSGPVRKITPEMEEERSLLIFQADQLTLI